MDKVSAKGPAIALGKTVNYYDNLFEFCIKLVQSLIGYMTYTHN